METGNLEDLRKITTLPHFWHGECMTQKSKKTKLRGNMKKTLLMLAAVVGMATVAKAQLNFSVAWDTTGLSGITADPLAGASSGDGAAFITPISFTRGSGLVAASSSNAWSSNNWSTDASIDYLEFGFTIADGYSVDLSNLFLGTSTSASGPRDMAITLDGNTVVTFQNDGSNFVNTAASLSSLTNLTGTVTFQIITTSDVSANGTGTIGSSGAFRIARYSDGVNLMASYLTGTVTAVPEPQAYALAVAGLLLTVVMMRRRRAC